MDIEKAISTKTLETMVQKAKDAYDLAMSGFTKGFILEESVKRCQREWFLTTELLGYRAITSIRPLMIKLISGEDIGVDDELKVWVIYNNVPIYILDDDEIETLHYLANIDHISQYMKSRKQSQ